MKNLKSSRDEKKLRNVKNESEYIGKKESQIYNDIKKSTDFKIVHRIDWGGVISQCSLHQAKGGGWF